MKKNTASIPFTGYQKFAIFILAATQFSVILDFMIMSPLGDMLMKSLELTTKQFGAAVSGYAISAGISGLITAMFADRFDRKKLLLFFYIGFIGGTFCCSMANSFATLLAARIVTGLFGGVIGSISMAIITDLFDIHHRGRVMGFVQMGFGTSQVLGLPISLFIADIWGWQAPFLLVVIIAIVIAVAIALKMQPVTKHLALQQKKNPFVHLLNTVAKKEYRMGFLATALLSLGGFMMMPFGSAFAINNLGISQHHLFLLFMVSGASSLIIMPQVGKLSDRVDKFTIFAIASLWMIGVVCIYTNQANLPLWVVMIFNVTLMMGIMSRMVPATALITGIPEMQDRGAFMSVNSSLQQIAGGIAAMVAGTIVSQKNHTSPLEHYNILGYVVSALSLVAVAMLYRVSVMVKKRLHEQVI